MLKIKKKMLLVKIIWFKKIIFFKLWNNFPPELIYTVVGDIINIMKKTFLFKFLFLKRFFSNYKFTNK